MVLLEFESRLKLSFFFGLLLLVEVDRRFPLSQKFPAWNVAVISWQLLWILCPRTWIQGLVLQHSSPTVGKWDSHTPSKFPLHEMENQGFLLTMGLKGLLEAMYIHIVYEFGIQMVSVCYYTNWAIFFHLAWVREKKNVKMTWSTHVKMTPSQLLLHHLVNSYWASILCQLC